MNTSAIKADTIPVVKLTDMPEEIQREVQDVALLAIKKCNTEKEIATFIREEFDQRYNKTWHCVVGRNFGGYVTHESKHYIYFYVGQLAVLLWKSAQLFVI
eukprot:TRINITY_DN7094_c0_g1_i2.p4 TRINITY_DN7094_c0_g1~~TRINITY_DN7094_c0_g1_i2.p4  ORF type:complete len:101 (+),score=26.90 TRINITY_DN7094_c0_g1_i2:300-602(+)